MQIEEGTSRRLLEEPRVDACRNLWQIPEESSVNFWRHLLQIEVGICRQISEETFLELFQRTSRRLSEKPRRFLAKPRRTSGKFVEEPSADFWTDLLQISAETSCRFLEKILGGSWRNLVQRTSRRLLKKSSADSCGTSTRFQWKSSFRFQDKTTQQSLGSSHRTSNNLLQLSRSTRH